MIHQLKITEKYFKDITCGDKTFEVRENDRNYTLGDFLALNEINENKEHTGRCCLVEITYILNDENYCKKDYVTLGIKPCAIATEYDPLRNVARNNLSDRRVPIYGNAGE